MNNFRRSIPDNTNRHDLILTHSLSRFTLPRCGLYSDNPGLWDIQFSSWDFCESNAKVMSLIKSASSWFQGITRTTRRLIRQQTSGHHNLVTSGDSGRLPVTIHALVTKLQATHATGLAHACIACAARFIAMTSDHWQTDRQTAIFTIAGLFPTRGNTTGHTHSHSVTAVSLNTASTSGILLHDPAFQRFTLFFRGLLKLLASYFWTDSDPFLWQCH